MPLSTKIQKSKLREFGKQLVAAGFRVWENSSPDYAWLIFSVDDSVGYLQINDLSYEFQFSTIHKPSKSIGTGFRFCETSCPTVEMATNCCQCIAPNWASSSDRRIVKKYSLSEYLSEKNTNLTELTE